MQTPEMKKAAAESQGLDCSLLLQRSSALQCVGRVVWHDSFFQGCGAHSLRSSAYIDARPHASGRKASAFERTDMGTSSGLLVRNLNPETILFTRYPQYGNLE